MQLSSPETVASSWCIFDGHFDHWHNKHRKCKTSVHLDSIPWQVCMQLQQNIALNRFATVIKSQAVLLTCH